jgi:hypothetical protein
MKLDTTLIQWLSTPVRDDADFLNYCNRDFMQARKESDYCFTIYFDKSFESQTHTILDRALEKFQLETV